MQTDLENMDATPSPKPHWLKRWLIIGGRTIFWLVLLMVGWSFFASVIPPLPGPSTALRAGLRVTKNVTDGIYLLVRQGDLEEAAEQVREEAVEHGPEDTTISDVDRLSQERRARLPVHPLYEDSVLHAQ